MVLPAAKFESFDTTAMRWSSNTSNYNGDDAFTEIFPRPIVIPKPPSARVNVGVPRSSLVSNEEVGLSATTAYSANTSAVGVEETYTAKFVDVPSGKVMRNVIATSEEIAATALSSVASLELTQATSYCVGAAKNSVPNAFAIRWRLVSKVGCD